MNSEAGLWSSITQHSSDLYEWEAVAPVPPVRFASYKPPHQLSGTVLSPACSLMLCCGIGWASPDA